MGYFEVGGEYPRLINISDYDIIYPSKVEIEEQSSPSGRRMTYRIIFCCISYNEQSTDVGVNKRKHNSAITEAVYFSEEERDEQYSKIKEIWMNQK